MNEWTKSFLNRKKNAFLLFSIQKEMKNHNFHFPTVNWKLNLWFQQEQLDQTKIEKLFFFFVCLSVSVSLFSLMKFENDTFSSFYYLYVTHNRNGIFLILVYFWLEKNMQKKIKRNKEEEGKDNLEDIKGDWKRWDTRKRIYSNSNKLVYNILYWNP